MDGNSVQVIEDWIPKLGMEFDNEECAYNFYNEYGRRSGFSVRKDSTGKNKLTKEITSRLYVCSKEGIRLKSRRENSPKNSRPETRCGCLATMGIKLNRVKGKFCVYLFKEEHNHPLVNAACSHLLSSQRNISDIHGSSLQLADRAGIPIRSAFELFGRQAGGRECLGFTKADLKNYLSGRRQRSLIYGETGTIHEYFKRQSNLNPSFYYDIQFDSDEYITNIFWADARMITDYGQFGDVVSFDTTYKVNKAHRPFGAFVGFNHHRETVLFGAALMYDETAKSFQWLFRTFLEAMSRKPPKTILTDQDAAMAIAIDEELPSTFHRLCIWHIMQNALKHTNHIASTSHHESTSIKGHIAYFMDNIDDESEFLVAWDTMLEDYNVRDNRWLKGLFDVRRKWAYCYVSLHWSAGMKSTQLSESFNAALKNYLKSDHDLVQFFNHFDRVVADKRESELSTEYNLCHRIPKVKMSVRMLEHASTIYTKRIFDDFQEEYRRSLEHIIRSREVCEDGRMVYTIGCHHSSRRWLVERIGDDELTCTCRKFEGTGIVCEHCIKIFRDEIACLEVPSKYFLKRWSRDARSTSVSDMHGRAIAGDTNLLEFERARNLCRSYTKISYRAAQSERAFRRAEFLSKILHDEIEGIIRSELSGVIIDNEDGPACTDSLNTPTATGSAIGKGFKKRHDPFRKRRREKSALEKALIKRKKTKTQSTSELSRPETTPQNSQSSHMSAFTPTVASSLGSAPTASQPSQSYPVVPSLIPANFGPFQSLLRGGISMTQWPVDAGVYRPVFVPEIPCPNSSNARHLESPIDGHHSSNVHGVLDSTLPKFRTMQ